MVGGVGDRQVAVGAEPVGEEVVEHAAVLAAQHAVLRAADARSSTTSLESSRCSSALGAAARCVSISPMCETSKTPAASRTATCSARMPSYWTGISQPANGDELRAGGDVAVVQRGPAQGEGHAAAIAGGYGGGRPQRRGQLSCVTLVG